MRLKIYHTGSVEEALERAKTDIGPDAMLVHSKPSSGSGRYEVVFASPIATSESVVEGPLFPAIARRQESGGVYLEPPAAPSPKRDFAGFRDELTSLMYSLDREPEFPVNSQMRSVFDSLYAVLTGAEVPARIAGELIEALRPRIEPRLPELPSNESARLSVTREFLKVLLEEKLPGDGLRTDGQSILALVGPPGAGKTTTVAKLAVHLGLANRRPCHLISVDNLRIGGGEQLRCLAAILGVSFTHLDSPGQLAGVIAACRSQALILIDTPGYSSADIELASELADALESAGAVETHLVLPADMRTSDMDRHVRRYSLFHPSHLLFTRIDESGVFGGIWMQSRQSGLPVSFLATGPRIPEDIEPATPVKIAGLVLGDPLLSQGRPAQYGLARAAGAGIAGNDHPTI